jgi:hypothetical protein
MWVRLVHNQQDKHSMDPYVRVRTLTSSLLLDYLGLD